MNFSPFPTLKTDRLLLRETTLSDNEEVFHLRSDLEIIKYIKRAPQKNIKEAETFINKVATDIASGICIEWSITLIDQPKMIGSICLWNIKENEKTAELGYALMTNYHNKGIMTEAITAVLQYGFETMQLKMIDAYTDFENKASVSLLLKSGFVLNDEKRDEENERNRVYEITSL